MRLKKNWKSDMHILKNYELITIENIVKYFVVNILIFSVILSGCTASMRRSIVDPSSFDSGMKFLNEKNFEKASYYFAELAKEGNPASMNNLGAALLMVNRKDEAIYWFQQATLYGDKTAAQNLISLGESVPAAILIGTHQSQINQIHNAEFINNFIYASILGVAVGVSLKYNQYSSRTYKLNENLTVSPSTFHDTTQSKISEEGCTSDYSCGIGFICVKAPLNDSGVCMKSVNEYGLQQYNMPSLKSVGPNHDLNGQCSFDTDCPIGFKCDRNYKACIKTK